MTEPQRADSLLARTVREGGQMVGWRLAARVLGLLSTLALARLLIPADFDLVAPLCRACFSAFAMGRHRDRPSGGADRPRRRRAAMGAGGAGDPVHQGFGYPARCARVAAGEIVGSFPTKGPW
jgi:hypothetical protein